ncbi:polysaccharide deacetylase [Parashewanella spongiae]|uniref:Polysaccharide deacetylase n=1 Tax=Parashewanella spongiae TaxID=342950 RepID=A0A3A6U596_9GAMM|nr:polysaccharide deacetylase family protein [Parashewanella spongiae]MCL1077202.1 polysaccharide deacetylase family protein [Parashewanella spongiae]RJY19373.1 polysaccharide deacetylase [Parashewanella spongiae]
MLRNFILASLLMVAKFVNAAVILQYHNVSTTTPAVTSVTPEQFAEHMEYLADNKFSVIPLSELVSAIKNKQILPDKTVAITFDDGYRNIYENAHPILQKMGFPYAMFIAIEPIERKFAKMMSWEQIITITNEGGAEIMNHSYSHDHLIRLNEGETKKQWLERIRKNIVDTEKKIAEKTGDNFKILAYPYGEYNHDITTLITELGYAAVGQQSGAAGVYSELTALPRFPIAGAYASLKQLKTKLNSLNMPIVKQVPLEPQITAAQHRPVLKLTLEMTDIRASQMMCYISRQGAKKPTWLSDNELEISADKDLSAGRSRYNCTVPSKTKNGYYWFSHTWIKPKANGEWLAE